MSTVIAPESGTWGGTPPEYAGVPFDRKRIKTRLPARDRDGDGSASGEPLATFLGLFSIGLGLWELTDPHGVAARTGTPYPGIIRAYGAREIASGLAILSTPRPAGGLWSRVAGDALDIATAAASYAEAGGDADRRRKVVQTLAALVGVTVLDVVAASCHSSHG